MHILSLQEEFYIVYNKQIRKINEEKESIVIGLFYCVKEINFTCELRNELMWNNLCRNEFLIIAAPGFQRKS